MPGTKDSSYSWKKPAAIAGAVMVLLVLGGLVFWRERMLFYDASYISFRIINLHRLQIMEHRYGSFITQMVPLAGAALHLSLKAILIAYSLSFPVFYLLVFLLLCRWKAWPLAILLALYLTLFVSDTFFWTNNEVHQGTAWLLLWLGMMWQAHARKWPPGLVLALSLPLMALAIFTHPLVIFSALFLWGFFLLERRFAGWPRWLLLALSVALVILIIWKKQLSSNGWYDAGKIEQITGAGMPQLVAALGNNMSLSFLKEMLYQYWLFPLLLLAGMIALFRNGKPLLAVWTVLNLALLYLLVCLSFPLWLSFHSESEWMTFSLVGGTPFVLYVLPRIKPVKASLLLAVVFSVRLVYIGLAAPVFMERRQMIVDMLRQMERRGITKLAIMRNGANLDFGNLAPWSLPVESLYQSALNGEPVNRTLIVTDSADLQRVLALPPNQFAGPWEAYKPQELNSRYFRFDTAARYQAMTLQELMQ